MTIVLLKTIIFTVLVPGTVTILIPYRLVSSESARSAMNLGAAKFLGVAPILLGTCLYFWCAWNFAYTGRGTPAPIDPPKELVARGPYRHVRNPMYVAVVSVLLGEAMLFESRTLFQYAVIAFVFYYFLVVLYEESVLKRKFGESYQTYCRTTPRWLPFRIRA